MESNQLGGMEKKVMYPDMTDKTSILHAWMSFTSQVYIEAKRRVELLELELLLWDAAERPPPSKDRKCSAIIPTKDRMAPGLLCGNRIDALVDTGAGNIISAGYLTSLGLVYDKSVRPTISRANGSAFTTLGIVSLPWKFAGETDEHTVKFSVVSERFCTSAVVLGGQFMQATKTLTHFAHRITRKLRRLATPRVFLQGEPQLRMRGHCGGLPVAAVPDTGSDVDLLSPDMAHRLKQTGHEILRGPEHEIFLELPGKKPVRTAGVVRAIDFRFRDGRWTDSYIRDFHILPGLPADVLIGDDILEEADAFRQYEDHLVELEDDECEMTDDFFLNIRFLMKNPEWLTKVKKFFKRSKEQDALDNVQTQSHNIWCDQQIEILNDIEALIQSNKSEEEKNLEIRRLEALHWRLLLDRRKVSSGPVAESAAGNACR